MPRLGYRDHPVEEGGCKLVGGVRLPNQALGLVCTVSGLYSPDVNPHSVRLRILHAGDHVLVSCDEHDVAHRAVPGQRDDVGSNQGVDAFLRAVSVEVSQADLDVGKGGYLPLLDGRYPVARGVEPIKPEEAVSEIAGGPGEQRGYQSGRVDT